ncbi:hypothetical protein DFS34DRAFT_678205 [Phlyctochytrium arcticum]|nr:hypothetical protein DFS34DRAFT_678205 [Phlyctochytrium arcticum]
MGATTPTYWTMGRVPKPPREGKAFQWVVHAAEFVPAAMGTTPAMEERKGLNPNAKPFVPSWRSTAQSAQALNPLAPIFVPKTPAPKPAQALNPLAPVFVPKHAAPQPADAAPAAEPALEPLAPEVFTTDPPPMYISYLSPYCPGPWPVVYLYIVPVYSQ